jgi:predicted DNA-binding protein
MKVRLKTETESRLIDLAARTGRSVDDIVEDALVGYISEVTALADFRDIIESRYDDLKSGRVKPIDGEAFFESLRLREKDLLKKKSRE